VRSHNRRGTEAPCERAAEPACRVRPAPSVDGRPSAAGGPGAASSDDRDAASRELRGGPTSKLTRDVFSRELL